MPHPQLVELYRHAHIAVDVFVPNVERELAFPSRTVNYLWCGLPVIHASFSEVAKHIRDYEAGWVVAHDDQEALRETVIGVLANPDEARRRGENAQRLARERFSWNLTAEPLDAFVRRPYIRAARGSRKRDAAFSPRSAGVAQPVAVAGSGQPRYFGNVLGANGTLSPELVRIQHNRRTLVSQLAAKTAALTRELAPLRGTRSRPELTGRRKRFLLSELTDGRSHGQRFLSPHDGLSGVRVVVGTFKRRNTASLRLHLRDTPAGQDIYSIEIASHQLRESQSVTFRFPPIDDSAQRWFYLVAESPDGAPGDAVTLWATERLEGIRGQRYEDGLPASGHILMSLEFNGTEG